MHECQYLPFIRPVRQMQQNDLKNLRKPGFFMFRTLANIFKRVYINKISAECGICNKTKLKGEKNVVVPL